MVIFRMFKNFLPAYKNQSLLSWTASHAIAILFSGDAGVSPALAVSACCSVGTAFFLRISVCTPATNKLNLCSAIQARQPVDGIAAVCNAESNSVNLLIGLSVLAGILALLAMQSLLPMKAVRLRLGTLLAADTTTLAPAVNANKMALIAAPFALTENLTLASLTLASGGGLDPITGNAGAQEVAVDPVTNEQVVQISPPVGGFRWVSSGGGPYPKNIYGYCLVDNGVATLLGATLFSAPIVLTGDGQFIEVDPSEMRFVLQPLA
jgi:hypothetical protein